MDFSTLGFILIPPLAGGIIGYFTNDLAIRMLFRPYKARYLGKTRLPFTPGLIPRNQERLAQRVADTIMESLLTPSELEKITQRLLKTERVQTALLWLLRLALKQIQAEQEEKTAKILADILHDLMTQSFPRLLDHLAHQDDFLEEQMDHLFERVVLELRLSDRQARQLADSLLRDVLPPDILRQALIEFLTDRNILVIDEGFREKTSGTAWVVANLFGIQNSLIRLRAFCIDEPEIANARLQELILSLEIRDRLRFWFQQVSLQNLPESTLEQLRQTTKETIRTYLQTRGGELLMSLSDSIDWPHFSGLLVQRLRDSDVIHSSLEVVSWELALILENYLEEELEILVAKILPILSLEKLIVDRVMATTPEHLEATVQGIVRSELQAIVNLGGILGVVIGSLQSIWLLVG
ncbi:MAG: DUF445 domain-containing protein [Spirulina sp. SIO3F2]|nr:DUF445 domain-containing protein [Spirulina sp. SIO3F2]